MARKLVSTTPDDERDEWRTPPHIFQLAQGYWGSYDLDAAATADNALCLNWLGPGSDLGEDALQVCWGDVADHAWCNPPYSPGLLGAFVSYARAQVDTTDLRAATLLLPATTDVRWFHDHIWRVDRPRPGVVVVFLTPRVKFLRPDGSVSTRPHGGSMLVQFTKRTT
jgi:phage N-6-adenine-methyltransferase